jgi:hypothetical protein
MMMSSTWRCGPRERMHRTHAEQADDATGAKRADKLIAGVALLSHLPQELVLGQVRPQLHDDREDSCPFMRLEPADFNVHS